MTQSGDTVEEALDLARRGMAYEACERLWPLVRDPSTRDEAVFTLAYCFERAKNLPTAAYLYGWVADRHPEFNVAARRLIACRDELDARGLHEDFADSGHVDCACGAFRYRAELGLCPYCGLTPEAASASEAPEATPLAEETPGPGAAPESSDVLQRVREDLDHAWKSIQSKFDEFTSREDLSGAAQRAQILAKELSARAKQLSETKTGQSLRGAADRVREETRSTADREEFREARTRLENWTRDAAERLEDLARSERVQSAGRTALTTLERFVARLQGVIDRVKGAPPDDPNP